MSASAAATAIRACPYGAPQYNAAKGHMTGATAAMTASQRAKSRFWWSPGSPRALDFGPIDELRKNGQLAAVAHCRPRTSPSRAL